MVWRNRLGWYVLFRGKVTQGPPLSHSPLRVNNPSFLVTHWLHMGLQTGLGVCSYPHQEPSFGIPSTPSSFPDLTGCHLTDNMTESDITLSDGRVPPKGPYPLLVCSIWGLHLELRSVPDPTQDKLQAPPTTCWGGTMDRRDVGTVVRTHSLVLTPVGPIYRVTDKSSTF
jgi:hypothetical protein